jgi:glycerophosphoryl diester phosphodiesterase
MTRAPVRPDWLVARPIAHRGLHRKDEGVIENTPTAARDAIAKNFAIECDVQLSADGEAMVFHDFTLDRLTTRAGKLCELTARELGQIAYKAAADKIVSLGDFLALIGGRVPLVCEIKSAFDGDMRLAERTARTAAAYAGPVALKSFDPDVVTHLRRRGGELGVADRPLGVVAEAAYDAAEWSHIPADKRRDMAGLLHWRETDPDFLSYHVNDLPNAASFFPRLLGAPVMTWTVRRPDQAARARAYADQMVFEGFAPE